MVFNNLQHEAVSSDFISVIHNPRGPPPPPLCTVPYSQHGEYPSIHQCLAARKQIPCRIKENSGIKLWKVRRSVSLYLREVSGFGLYSRRIEINQINLWAGCFHHFIAQPCSIRTNWWVGLTRHLKAYQSTSAASTYRAHLWKTDTQAYVWLFYKNKHTRLIYCGQPVIARSLQYDIN